MQYIYNYFRGFPLLPSPPLPRPSPSPPPPPPLLLPDLLDFGFDSGFVFVTGMHVMASSTTALWLAFSTFALNTNKSQSRNAVRYYRYYTHFKSSDSLSRNEHSSVFSSSPLSLVLLHRCSLEYGVLNKPFQILRSLLLCYSQVDEYSIGPLVYAPIDCLWTDMLFNKRCNFFSQAEKIDFANLLTGTIANIAKNVNKLHWHYKIAAYSSVHTTTPHHIITYRINNHGLLC